MPIEELQKDSEELGRLLLACSRPKVRDSLTKLKAEVDREISVLELKARLKDEKDNDASPKRYFAELTEYAWDQSDKFVKFFISLAGVQTIDEANVTVEFTDSSMKLHVSDLNGKDYGLTVNNLLMPISVENSYRKIKTDMVAIYLKKKDEGKKWSHLTKIEKRLKEKEDEQFKTEPDGSEEPGAALVNLMKKMYDRGDAKTKQMIAKAWTESQEKARDDIGKMPGADALMKDL